MYLTGFADEASYGIDGQIKATKELGWSHIEARNINGVNIHNISDKEFDEVCKKLSDAGISINGFGSEIANWASKISDPPKDSYDKLNKAIVRMKKLGTKFIRIMSYNTPDEQSSLDNEDLYKEIFKRIKHMANIATDSDIILLHENCNTWGGRSYEHTLKLIEAVNSPALKLVFDTGNPIFEKDIRGEEPYKYQDAMEFYQNVKEHIAHIHIKDGHMENDEMVYSYPNEGDGYVKEILLDLKKNGYDAGISIEPHIAEVLHDKTVQASEETKYTSYVEYGKRLEKILEDIGWNHS